MKINFTCKQDPQKTKDVFTVRVDNNEVVGTDCGIVKYTRSEIFNNFASDYWIACDMSNIEALEALK